MQGKRNQVATKLVEKAYQLHKFLYGKAYPYPLSLSVTQGKISMQTENIFKFKYVPFIFSLVIISGIIGSGCCIFVPFYKLFCSSSNVQGILPIIACGFLGCGFFLECGINLAYIGATEIGTMINQMFEFEQNYCQFRKHKFMDWPGILLIAVQVILAPSLLILPLLGTVCNLDPSYYVLELLLPSPYTRTLSTIILTYLLRLCLAILWVFEFQRFGTILLFLAICGAHTMARCTKEITSSSQNSEKSIFRYYTILRLFIISSDYFLRNAIALMLICGQVFITITWWIVLKCWSILPTYITLVFFLSAVIVVTLFIILLPQVVHIYETSLKFIIFKRSTFHTYNKYNKNYYYFLKWRSQRMLSIRFGVQFTINKDTPINYLAVLMTNLTNSVLLINP